MKVGQTVCKLDLQWFKRVPEKKSNHTLPMEASLGSGQVLGKDGFNPIALIPLQPSFCQTGSL